jgi:hypothetical protein
MPIAEWSSLHYIAALTVALTLAMAAFRISSVTSSRREVLKDISSSLSVIANAAQELIRGQQELIRLEAAKQLSLPPSSGVVIDHFEVFHQDATTRSLGVAVVRVRNLGPGPVFLERLTKDEAGVTPGSVIDGRALAPWEFATLDLVLGVDDPPLDGPSMTVWYQDMEGMHWSISCQGGPPTSVEPTNAGETRHTGSNFGYPRSTEDEVQGL